MIHGDNCENKVILKNVSNCKLKATLRVGYNMTLSVVNPFIAE